MCVCVCVCVCVCHRGAANHSEETEERSACFDQTRKKKKSGEATEVQSECFDQTSNAAKKRKGRKNVAKEQRCGAPASIRQEMR